MDKDFRTNAVMVHRKDLQSTGLPNWYSAEMVLKSYMISIIIVGLDDWENFTVPYLMYV